MNRKTLVILLMLPLMVFAADQAFTAFRSEEGGGKEKDKQKTEATQAPQDASQATEAAANEPLTAPQEEGTENKVTESPAGKASSSKMSTAELVEELKSGQTQAVEEYFNLDYEQDLLWRGHEAVSEATREFLDDHLLAKLKKSDPYSLNLARSFGRCPSGYHYNLMTGGDQMASREGWMILEQGCSDKPIARFRFDKALTKVQVKVSNEVGYLPLDRYLYLLKKAES